MPKCDFCSHPEPVWRYAVCEGTPWAACEECARLVDAGELLPLVHRIIHRLAPFPSIGSMPEIRHAMETTLGTWLDRAFWSVRTGLRAPLRRRPAGLPGQVERWLRAAPGDADDDEGPA